ncbi:DUF1963 domain-containing protein [Erythrobacter sp. JK5]|uniref:DUF1963 domain-containing protein n=1 Tax=Erythrobacter sp. JK5 TaxID=2829500 RepID=UPI001BA64740|nr:DUF1963 domain-containing protein [Erythrobacter sp. JK5]QUL38252.1 DUF1963 domain-containing protein [Erythrobacter sp. JK5]
MSEQGETSTDILRAAELFKRYQSPAILLHRPYPPHSVPESLSYFGGLPTLPSDCEWPRTTDGVALHFFCQIDCSEITWSTPLPKRGILYFFGRDDEEQSWNIERPEECCRVIFADDKARVGGQVQPPPDLKPIRGMFQESAFREVALDSDPPPLVHVKWPIQLCPMESFPDTSGLPPLIHQSNEPWAKTSRAFRHRNALRRIWPWMRPLPKLDTRPAPDQGVWDLYEDILPHVRTRAFERAIRRERGPRWDRFESYRAREVCASEEFPEYWFLVEFMLRYALRNDLKGARQYGDDVTPEFVAKRQKADQDVQDEAQVWLKRALEYAHGMCPTAPERIEFRDWLKSVDERMTWHGMTGRWLKESAKYVVRACAGDRAMSEALPQWVYDAADESLFPTSAEFSQMLGEAPASQGAQSADNPEICLLNLCSDPGVGWQFWDMGECSFWIDPDDLAARDFSRVIGMMAG